MSSNREYLYFNPAAATIDLLLLILHPKLLNTNIFVGLFFALHFCREFVCVCVCLS